MGTACDLKIRVADLDLTVRLSFKFRFIGEDTTCFITSDITDHGVRSIQIQVALLIQIDAAAAAGIRDQRKVDVVQAQIRVADQVGRSSCAASVGMRMRIDIQRKIFKRDITVRCIHTVLVQRQRAGTAAGNGQVLLIMELKTRTQRDICQQVDLVARLCRSDCLGQRFIGLLTDRTHSLTAACVVRRAGRIRVEIGDGVVCIQVFHKRRCRGRRCFRTVCIRSALHRVRLHRVRLSRAGSSMGGGGHNYRGLFL